MDLSTRMYTLSVVGPEKWDVGHNDCEKVTKRNSVSAQVNWANEQVYRAKHRMQRMFAMATNDPESRLAQLGYRLPSAPAPVGAYVPVLRAGRLVVTSGQLPFRDGKLVAEGRVGAEVDVETAQEAARICVLNALAQVKAALGTLDRVSQVVRLEGYVHSAEGFHQQPAVLNAASELLVAAFGEQGKHTRVALGIGSMPLNAPVQIALWVEAREE